MSSLELAWEIYSEGEDAVRVLKTIVSLPNVHGILHIPHPNPVDRNIPLVLGALNVDELRLGRFVHEFWRILSRCHHRCYYEKSPRSFPLVLMHSFPYLRSKQVRFN